MKFESVRDLIWELNLSFDLDTIRLVEQFLTRHVGPLQGAEQEELRYTVYAAAGIVVEQLKILAVDGKGLVSTGLTIELLMSKLEGLDIQKYLDHIDALLLKCKEASAELSHKLQQLKISYRLFCKYRKLISRLLEKVPGDFGSLLEDATSLVWAMYLLHKHQHPELDIEQQTGALIVSVVYVLNRMEVDKKHIDFELIRSEFSCAEATEDEEIAKTFDALLHEILVQRYNETNFAAFFSNMFKRQRLLDDLRMIYEQVKNPHLPVDEIKYLRLPKNLTPFKVSMPSAEVENKNTKMYEVLDFGDDNN